MSEDTYQVIDFDWLTKFANDLQPVSPDAPDTVFDILGVATRETVISTVLAYYLDEKKSHGLDRLFLDSLVSCMIDAGSKVTMEGLPSPYRVEREKGFIDILLTATDNLWAIIIENKIYHTLENELDVYWDSVRTEIKFGVVVTLKPLSTSDRQKLPKGFVNVTHKTWIVAVEKKYEPTESQKPDDNNRQRLLFADFLMAMKKTTASLTNSLENNENIRLFQQHTEKIDLLCKTKDTLEEYIQSHIDAVFEMYGFIKRQKQFYYPNEKPAESLPALPLRFFVENEVLTRNQLSIYFELYGESCSWGDQLKSTIQPFVTEHHLKQDNVMRPAEFYHLAHIEEPAMLTSDNLPQTLQVLVGQFFTKTDISISLVDHCRQFCQDHIKDNHGPV